MRFQWYSPELQHSGSDSGSIAAADESLGGTHNRGRKLGKILLGITGLAAILILGIYVFAGQIGLEPLRDNLGNRLKPAMHNIAEGVAHIWQETRGNISPLIERTRTALRGADLLEVSEGENAMDDAVEVSPLTGLAQSVHPDSDDGARESQVPNSIAEKADPVQTKDPGDVTRIVDSDPMEPVPSVSKAAALPLVEQMVSAPEAVISSPLGHVNRRCPCRTRHLQ